MIVAQTFSQRNAAQCSCKGPRNWDSLVNLLHGPNTPLLVGLSMVINSFLASQQVDQYSLRPPNDGGPCGTRQLVVFPKLVWVVANDLRPPNVAGFFLFEGAVSGGCKPVLGYHIPFGEAGGAEPS